MVVFLAALVFVCVDVLVMSSATVFFNVWSAGTIECCVLYRVGWVCLVCLLLC